jgi:hypothetical protein
MEWSCLDDNMLLYCQELCKLENNFDGLEYLHILQGNNEVTDELAKLGSSRAMVPTGVFLQKLHEPTIARALAKANKAVESSQETPPPLSILTESPEVMEIHSDWRTSFIIYLIIGGLLEDKVKCEQLHRRAGQYMLVNDELYRRGANDTNEMHNPKRRASHLVGHSHRSLRKSHWCKVTHGKDVSVGVLLADSCIRCQLHCTTMRRVQFFARQKHVSSHQLQTIPIT